MPEIDAKVPLFLLDGIELDPGRGVLRRGKDDVYLRPKSFQILLYLIEERERVVRKEELVERFWGDTAVTDDAIVQCIVDIRKVLGDDSRDPRYLRTFPKSGYRFIGEVEVRERKPEGEAERDPVEAVAAVPVRRRTGWLIGISGLVLLALVTAFVTNRKREGRAGSEVVIPKVPGKTSIAVMFFDNQSGDHELDWMREGLADMLITNLYRSDRLTLLSRQQLYVLLERVRHEKGAAIRFDEAVQAAGRSQADKFILGSFIRIGKQIRIDVRIHDTATGALIATDSVTTGTPEEVLSQMDALAARLGEALSNRIGAGAPDRGLTEVMTKNIDAYRYYSLAVEKSRAYHSLEAIELLKKAIKLDPDFAMAHARIGYTYSVGWGHSEAGRPYLDRAFELSSRLNDRDRLYIRAWYSISRLEYSEAIAALRELIARFPAEIEAYQRLGYLLRGEGRSDEALQVLLTGLKVDPESPDLFNAAGLIYSDKSQHAEALRMHRRYVELLPGEPNAHDSLGMSYQQAGRYEEAVAQYVKALQLNPEFDISVTHLCNTYFQMGRYKEALVQARRYIQIAPSENERQRGHCQAARIYLELGDYHRADIEIQLAISGSKSGDWIYLAVLKQRKDQSAYIKLENAVIQRPASDNRGQRISGRLTHFSTGWLAKTQGRHEDALAEFREALKSYPPVWNIDTYEDCLGNAYLEVGRAPEAIREYQRILALNPRYPKLHFHMGLAYELLGDKGAALDEFQKFLEEWKGADRDVPEVQTAAQKLARK